MNYFGGSLSNNACAVAELSLFHSSSFLLHSFLCSISVTTPSTFTPGVDGSAKTCGSTLLTAAELCSTIPSVLFMVLRTDIDARVNKFVTSAGRVMTCELVAGEDVR